MAAPDTSHSPMTLGASWRQRLRGGLVNGALLATTSLLLLAVIELTLRLTGFSFVLYPEEIEFGKPDPVLLTTGFQPDPALFWVTKDYHTKLSRLVARQPRLVLMGDSCTQLGAYDEALATLVATRQGADLSYANLGVAGWTSYQGLEQLRRDVLPLQPAVITIYYGWNDHWIGFGIEDKDIASLHARAAKSWNRLRLFQLATKASLALRSREAAYPNRVSLTDFGANLRNMVRLARDNGIRPLLLTAADHHTLGQEPAHLTARWLRDLDELVPLHQAYVETVRTVAAAERAPLCDLARSFDALSPAEIDAAFSRDGIHFTAEGDRHLASFLYDCLIEHNLIDQIVEAPRPEEHQESALSDEKTVPKHAAFL